MAQEAFDAPVLWSKTIATNLAKFHCDNKVESSNPSKPARGCRDPKTNTILFMAEANVTIEEQKKNAINLIDPLPFEQMY